MVKLTTCYLFYDKNKNTLKNGGIIMAKILLIEDEEMLREMLVDELSVLGHSVVEADNGEEG